MRKLFLALLIITGGIWIYFSVHPPPKSHKLILTGSSTVAPLAAEIAKRFESLHPDVRIDIQTGGSSRGINDVRAKLSDIGMVSRALKPNESTLFSFTIAQDGISIILNKANPVSTLTQRQIIDIYTGKITNWQSVGGHDAPITIVNKAEGHLTLALFLHYFGLQNTEIKPHVIIGDNQQGIKTVAGNSDAIGYVSIGAAEYASGHQIAIKLLPLQGVTAYVDRMPASVWDSGRTLSIHIYDLSMNIVGGDNRAHAAALVLIIMLIIINSLAIHCARYWQNRKIIPHEIIL